MLEIKATEARFFKADKKLQRTLKRTVDLLDDIIREANVDELKKTKTVDDSEAPSTPRP